MTDTQDQWPTQELTPAQERNRASAELVPFGGAGISPQNFAQLVDFAKQMATAKGAIPAHFRGSTGDCLAIIEIAQKFEMSAYMMARGTYFVNGAMAFDGQTIMAIIQKWCPLDGRLKYRWEGTHAEYDDIEVDETDRNDQKTGKKIWIKKIRVPSTRKIIVTGRMKGESEDLTYESPMIKDIKVKNSPLWVEDPDQQLIYFATRRWQRRWWPEGLLNIYARDEIDEVARPGDHATDVTPERPSVSILERLKAANNGDGPKEGFTEGFTEGHFVEAPPEPDTPKRGRPRRKPEIPATEPVTTAVVHQPPAASQAAPEDAGTVSVIPPVDEAGPADVAPEPPRASDPEPAPSVSPAAQVDGAGPVPVVVARPDPTNVQTWKDYCKAWLDEIHANTEASDVDVLAKWNGEQNLRNRCGVVAEDRQGHFAYMTAIVEEKRKRQAKRKD